MKRALSTEVPHGNGDLVVDHESTDETSIAYSGDMNYVAISSINFLQLQLSDLESPLCKLRTQCLLHLARCITMLVPEQQKPVTELLVKRLKVEPDKDLKCMIILLLEKFSQRPNINALLLLKCFTDELQCESIKVRFQLYNAIHKIFKVTFFLTTRIHRY
ncbi:uncharacterized protein BYT42DRAFT_405672 [Radiomyces spectabilis]|uniref:uncharacterized protein n=1 Tax=Radiomyces spectabilis TaxID=64574 RepID=UPI00221E4FAC|nr:uncharacterized protein BYT42DRAFT_405672 [Radiomyces spectabilis]KAI8374467.1 hypothetical protein BYT42DRAFT_405672 [Radiomyces spectabilis]